MENNFQKLSIIQLHKILVNKTISPEQLINFSLKRLKKYHNLNAVSVLLATKALKTAKNLKNIKISNNNFLFGIPFIMKDNIAIIGEKLTGSSNILTNFISNYDSTVNHLLTESNAISIAKSALDELGMGGDGLYANTGYVYNPWNKNYITGGSSSGSAALVAAGVVPFALGTDTGDSIRKPASFCGIVGYKPTYGLISRNGVIPYAPSLDTVGILSNYVEDIAIVLDCIAKQDDNDFTSLVSSEKNYFKNLSNNVKDLKIAVLNYDDYQWNNEIKSSFNQVIDALKSGGAKINYHNFNRELLDALLPVYMIISFAEANSCHAGLDGINFGVRKEGKNYQDTIIKTRKEGFGNVVKRRYVIGAYASSNLHQKELFLKAKKIRRLMVEEMNNLFKEYDAFIIIPTMNPAPKIKEVLEKNKLLKSEHNYMEDLLLLANFNGSPSINIPLTTINDLPVSININCAPFKDQITLNIANFLSKEINFENKLLGETNE